MPSSFGGLSFLIGCPLIRSLRSHIVRLRFAACSVAIFHFTFECFGDMEQEWIQGLAQDPGKLTEPVKEIQVCLTRIH
jgi:hypothetical protein